MGAVLKKIREIAAGRGAPDVAFEASLHQIGKVSGMIDGRD
jgi:hypothetical protein